SIEDDPAVARALREGLQREGYRVASCASAQQGIAYVQAHQPHLVLLDVRLPDLSGFDALRRLRGLGLKQPVLMLTVQSEEVDKVLGLELGADDYLAKPVRDARTPRQGSSLAAPQLR
ncbi:MAG: response regulator, partial [Pleurocapsa sp. SU_196_0]|nr:response regulator [Pleurocapsa sp. SU_196_0]